MYGCMSVGVWVCGGVWFSRVGVRVRSVRLGLAAGSMFSSTSELESELWSSKVKS